MTGAAAGATEAKALAAAPRRVVSPGQMATFLVAVLLLAVAAVALWLRPAWTSPIEDGEGRPVPGSVAVLEELTLGGVPQSVLIRGRSTAHPVLLFLHGGPGTSELGLVRAYNMAALEQRFTVVVWDQRGAGKSFGARIPESGMTVEAPRKALVWFERSAHLPNVEEPDAFNRFFLERLLVETGPSRAGGARRAGSDGGSPA